MNVTKYNTSILKPNRRVLKNKTKDICSETAISESEQNVFKKVVNENIGA
jgi:hypothetical protein